MTGSDAVPFLHRHRLPGRLTPLRRVTEFRGGRVVTHLAADDRTALVLANHLHRVVRRALLGTLASTG